MTEPHVRRMRASRLEAFSDGVLAIIITIMVLELRPPDEPTFAALRAMLPVFLAYALSFVMIGIYWNNHHHLLRATESISGAVMWANMHLLFWLSLVPFATAWVGREHSHSWPAALYGAIAFLCAVAYTMLVIAITRANPGSAVVRAIGADRKGYASLALYAAGTLLASVNPWFGYAAYVAVAAIWFIPDRRLSSIEAE
jgi:uncharacterized membrane protein